MSESVFMMFSHGLTQWSLGSVLIWFLISFQITIMGVTIYLHRVMAHRAADLHPLVRIFSGSGAGLRPAWSPASG